MIYDYFRVAGAVDTILDYADFLNHSSQRTFRNSIRDGMRFNYLWTRIPSDDTPESLYKLRIRESAQLKNCVGIVRHGHSSEDFDAQLSEVEDDGEERHR